MRLSLLAREYLKGYLIDNPEIKGFIFKVSPAGCSGFEYLMEPMPIGWEGKAIHFNLYGLNISIPPESLDYFEGTTLDYKVGKFEKGFEFTNKDRSTCGCGKSFTL